MLPPTIRRVWWQVERTAGASLAQYECTALLVDDDEIAPKYSTYCWPVDDGTPTENRVHLGLALATCTWVCVHLLGPWMRLLIQWWLKGQRS